MIYFASDIHLGAGERPAARERERRFVAWLDRAAKDAEAIFLVGDLFDFWFEYKRVVPKGFVRTLGKLAELTDRGIRVVFFAGNHDMWIRDYLTEECGVEIYTSPQEMTLYGKRLFIAHGDNMNIGSQWLLRLMNSGFRSRPLRWLFRWGVHPDLALKFGNWWSSQSRKAHNQSNEKAEANDTEADECFTAPLIDYARDYARTHKIDCFLFGHMHFARDYREEGLHTVHLGWWEKHPSYAVLDPSGEITLKRIE